MDGRSLTRSSFGSSADIYSYIYIYIYICIYVDIWLGFIIVIISRPPGAVDREFLNIEAGAGIADDDDAQGAHGDG